MWRARSSHNCSRREAPGVEPQARSSTPGLDPELGAPGAAGPHYWAEPGFELRSSAFVCALGGSG